MNLNIKNLVHNPSSLKDVCVRGIKQSISYLGQTVEHNLIEMLTAGDLDDLKNPNLPISLEDMCKYFHKFDIMLINTLLY